MFGTGAWGTHVANIDGLAPLTISCREVGEGVRWNGSSLCASEAASPRTAAAAAAIATSSAIASTKCTTTSTESTTTAETAAEASSSTEASATAEATSHSGVGEAINANFEDTALPVVAVELLDRISGVIRRFKDDDAGAFGPSVGSEVDISANDTPGTGFNVMPSVLKSNVQRSLLWGLTCLPKEVLEVLPSNGVGQLSKELAVLKLLQGEEQHEH